MRRPEVEGEKEDDFNLFRFHSRANARVLTIHEILPWTINPITKYSADRIRKWKSLNINHEIAKAKFDIYVYPN